MTSWFYGARSSDKMFMNPTSNGSACYFSKKGAVLRGLLEVIQRDAFMVHWLTHIPPKAVLKDTLPEQIQEMIYLFESLGLTLHILDTTAIAIPSVCVVAISEQSEVPQIVVSAASDVTFAQAIMNALEEMMTCTGIFFYEDDGRLKDELSDEEPFVSKLNKTSRQIYWRGAEKLELFHWFISGERISYSELNKRDLRTGGRDSEQLEACLVVLRALGTDYYPVAYSPKNTVQRDLGVHVAQVYIPKAFPFYLIERYGTFDSDRLQEFAQSRGIPRWELNPLPHMFP